MAEFSTFNFQTSTFKVFGWWEVGSGRLLKQQRERSGGERTDWGESMGKKVELLQMGALVLFFKPRNTQNTWKLWMGALVVFFETMNRANLTNLFNWGAGDDFGFGCDGRLLGIIAGVCGVWGKEMKFRGRFFTWCLGAKKRPAVSGRPLL